MCLVVACFQILTISLLYGIGVFLPRVYSGRKCRFRYCLCRAKASTNGIKLCETAISLEQLWSVQTNITSGTSTLP
ncbi:hypothetical protein GQ44DRAFT_706695, partial [Phaeosphaeriaceae sp. PMI808]